MKVSVITPTWRRARLLVERCIPSVLAQTYRDREHIVCSDGPDPPLGTVHLAGMQPLVRYVEVPDHDWHPMNYGSRARNHALEVATGEYIAYLDDDNAWRSHHLAMLVEALDENPDADFAYSQMVTHPQGTVIGSDPPVYGGIDTSMIVHRRALLDVARWPMPDDIADDKHAPDWAIVEAWLAGGARWVHVPHVTVNYHFAGS